jgi:uncharacterized protein YbjQ (UPF0145 family)
MAIIVTMAETVPGREIAAVLGIARGSIVLSRGALYDVAATVRSVLGGEIDEYSRLLIRAREEALARMQEHGRELGADAVVVMRLETASVMQGAAEVLAYGTAVRLVPLDGKGPWGITPGSPQ